MPGLPDIGLEGLHFGAPAYLWLLAAPACLLVLWVWQLARRRRDVAHIRRHRNLPIRERIPLLGGLSSPLWQIAALTLTILAVARPQATTSLIRTAGIDLVILQDGSASMRVKDVSGDRWKRSMSFLRAIGESLRWKDDRIAMALFAHIAAPQVRLTRDPNTYFFFLDHLDEESPFRLEDDTTWDTNTELGVYWGVRLVEKDAELNGPSPNARAFVLISDGQTWSGEVARALDRARQLDIIMFVVGVGTSVGGVIPEPPRPATTGLLTPPPPIRSSIDRSSLTTIATAGGGQYFELDRESDRDIANRIIAAARRHAGSRGAEPASQELYWWFLLGAACCLGLSVLVVQERVEATLWLAAAAGALLTVWSRTQS